MKLIIVRHGQTDANITGIIQGHGESNLTLLGKKQAQKIALRLKEEKIDYAYSSDLRRAKETAEEKFAVLKQKLTQSKDRLEGGRSLELHVGGHRFHVSYDTDEA